MPGLLRSAGLILLVVVLGAAFANTASAAPAWRFNGEQLEGEETILGGAPLAEFSFTGLTTECEGFLYIMKIKNSAGTGQAALTYLPVFDCATNSVCTVESSQASGLPWNVTAVTVGVDSYVVFKGVRISFVYGNPECVLYETEVEVEGTMGGLFDDVTESMTFNAATATATKTELAVFGFKAELKAVLSAEAFGPHQGEALSL